MTGQGAQSLDVRVASDEVGAVQTLAQRLAEEVMAAVSVRGRCRIALAGGETPRRLYEHLAGGARVGSGAAEAAGAKAGAAEAAEAGAGAAGAGVEVGAGAPRLSWEALEVFFGDERCVAPEDPRSNFHMAREALLGRVPVGRVFPMDGLAPPEEAAAAYAEALGTEPLDVVLLGLGADGHTASLFPGTPRLHDEPRVVAVTRSPSPPEARLSLTLRTLNAARVVLFLVTGQGKAAIFARVAVQAGRPDADLPAAMVRPVRGTVTWYLDAAAARLSPWRHE